MITRKMNERITFFVLDLMKDENGDPTNVRRDLFSCWSEIAKATTKEFRDRSTDSIESIAKRRVLKTFYIRFRTDVDSEQYIDWRGNIYQVIDTEPDWRSKDMLMVKAEVIE